MPSRFDPRIVAEMRFIESLNGGNEHSLGPEEQSALLAQRRAESPDRSRWMDLALLLEIQRKNQGLQEAHGSLEKLKGVLDKLTASPWHAAVFFCGFETAEGPRAMVYQGGGRRVVGLAEGLELERAIQECITALDEDHRLVLVLRDIQSLSYEEIVEITGIAIGTVKSRLHRARMALKEKLDSHFAR